MPRASLLAAPTALQRWLRKPSKSERNMQRSACGSQAAQVSTISTSRKVSHGAKAMSLPMREKACESPTSARALQVPHAPASLAGLHVCERLQSPLARSKADKSPQFGKADSHTRAREPCKSPCAASLAGLHVCERLQSLLARSKADKSPQFGKADSLPRT